MTKDHKESKALPVQRVQQDLLVQPVPLVPLVLPERLAQRAPLVQQERKVLQEILVRLGLQARQVPPVQPDPQVLQARRVIREQQVQQDLKVIKEALERLDQLVR
jgi:hypothetical protein